MSCSKRVTIPVAELDARSGSRFMWGGMQITNRRGSTPQRVDPSMNTGNQSCPGFLKKLQLLQKRMMFISGLPVCDALLQQSYNK